MSKFSLHYRLETARHETLDMSRVPKSRVPCQLIMYIKFANSKLVLRERDDDDLLLLEFKKV